MHRERRHDRAVDLHFFTRRKDEKGETFFTQLLRATGSNIDPVLQTGSSNGTAIARVDAASKRQVHVLVVLAAGGGVHRRQETPSIADEAEGDMTAGFKTQWRYRVQPGFQA